MFSDKIFIVHVYALEISCLCPYKESEISENDTSYFRLPQSLQSAQAKLKGTELELKLSEKEKGEKQTISQRKQIHPHSFRVQLPAT